ncbi:hypothetical protein ACFFWD_23180 [Bradyrhizobium erythrophlei]|uniref:hypothetical protein n=1 Tax=Bradyrhizobium erythrophlei TaxID=1437360 RepID=UPI0035E8AA9A
MMHITRAFSAAAPPDAMSINCWKMGFSTTGRPSRTDSRSARTGRLITTPQNSWLAKKSIDRQAIPSAATAFEAELAKLSRL